MSREKQIEEMAKIACNATNPEIQRDCTECPFDKMCDIQNSCEALYDMGYRKQSDIVKCEDCANSTVLGHCQILTSKNGTPIKVNPNDFCSWGIKKE